MLRKDYNDSVITALMTIYPDKKFLPWKYGGYVSKKFWDNERNVKLYLHWVQSQLNMKSLDGWYNITNSLLVKLHGSYLIQKYGGIPNLLQKMYPNHHWDLMKFKEAKMFSPTSKQQLQLFEMVQQMFPTEDVFMNFDLNVDYQNMNKTIQLDIFLPQLKVINIMLSLTHSSWHLNIKENSITLLEGISKNLTK